MQKVCFKVEDRFLGNKIFLPYSGDPTCWDWNVPHLLKTKFENQNLQISTQDQINEASADIIIYNLYPKTIQPNNKLKVLLALESVAVIERLSEKKYLDQFDLVFTCNDKHVDNKKIFKINFSFDEALVNLNFPVKEKFISCFSANKFSNHIDELYSERIKAIEYFNNNYPKDFDLFGAGWNMPFIFPNIYNFFRFLNTNLLFRIISKMLNIVLKNIPIIKSFIYRKYDAYKGYTNNKFEELSKYKFSICYENLLNNNGYITEKIFDCLRLGVIPIYLGASNIYKYIPDDIYIDKSKYNSYDELNAFLQGIDQDEYKQYIERIRSYLTSNKVKIFTDQYVADLIFNKIIEKIKT